MTFFFKKLFCAASVTLILALPFFSSAITPEEQKRCDDFKKQFQLGGVSIIGDNPVFCSATDIILFAINYLTILAGVVAVLFLIVGGFWYLTSAGSEEQAEKGKKAIINSVIGLVVIILAFTIVRIISGTLHGWG